MRGVTARGIHYEIMSCEQKGASNLVMVMGYSGSMVAWTQGFLDKLRRHFNVLILDNRGTGSSLKPRELEAYAVSEMALDLASVVEEGPFKNFHLLGYSLGGCIALEYALQNLSAKKIESLLLVASTLGGEAYTPPPGDTLARLGDPQGNSLLELNRWVWEICMSPANVVKHTQALQSTVVTEREQMTPRFALRGQLWGYKNFNRCARMNFGFPVSVITGDSDPLTSPVNSVEIAKHIERAELNILKDCEHMPHIEAADDFVKQILDFCLKEKN